VTPSLGNSCGGT